MKKTPSVAVFAVRKRNDDYFLTSQQKTLVDSIVNDSKQKSMILETSQQNKSRKSTIPVTVPQQKVQQMRQPSNQMRLSKDRIQKREITNVIKNCSVLESKKKSMGSTRPSTVNLANSLLFNTTTQMTPRVNQSISRYCGISEPIKVDKIHEPSRKGDLSVNIIPKFMSGINDSVERENPVKSPIRINQVNIQMVQALKKQEKQFKVFKINLSYRLKQSICELERVQDEIIKNSNKQNKLLDSLKAHSERTEYCNQFTINNIRLTNALKHLDDLFLQLDQENQVSAGEKPGDLSQFKVELRTTFDDTTPQSFHDQSTYVKKSSIDMDQESFFIDQKQVYDQVPQFPMIIQQHSDEMIQLQQEVIDMKGKMNELNSRISLNTKLSNQQENRLKVQVEKLENDKLSLQVIIQEQRIYSKQQELEINQFRNNNRSIELTNENNHKLQDNPEIM